MSVRLYVGNLPKDVVEKDALTEFFAEAGENASTKVIKDRKTGKCRGFAFVTVPTDEEADAFIEKYSGQSFMDSVIKIEKALPRAKGEETEEGEATTTATATATTTAAVTPKTPVSAPTKNTGKRKSNGGGKKTTNNSNYSTGTPASAQPDPRWANELEKLKEMLQKQTTNV
jgi:RNA recognition motif-containing protein